VPNLYIIPSFLHLRIPKFIFDRDNRKVWCNLSCCLLSERYGANSKLKSKQSRFALRLQENCHCLHGLGFLNSHFESRSFKANNVIITLVSEKLFVEIKVFDYPVSLYALFFFPFPCSADAEVAFLFLHPLVAQVTTNWLPSPSSSSSS
jgi:hypothetical protein